MFNIGDKLTEENYTEGAIWCSENGATVELIEDEYVIVAIPEPLPPTYEEVKQTRADLYENKVDTLMAEHYRKKTFNLFAEGEEEALLAEVEAKVAEIKENNPYPEVEEV